MKNIFESSNETPTFSTLIKHFVKEGETTLTISTSSELKEALDKTPKIIFDNYILVFDLTHMTCMVVKDAPRSRWGYKIIQNYRYKTYDRMVQHVSEFIDNINSRKTHKEAEKTKQKEARKNVSEYFKVGDILYDSWGYDQTNIDFYQVTRITGQSVWIRPIGGKPVESEGYGGMAGMIKPVPNSFKGEEVRKNMRVYGNNAYLTSKFGSISKYTSGDKGIYYSWGH